MNHFFKRATATVLSLTMTCGLMPAVSASIALGDDLHTETVGLAEGLDYTTQYFWSNTYSDLRIERYLTWDMTESVTPTILYGNYVTSLTSVPTLAARLEAEGYRVVAAINGDYYNPSTGSTVGVLISDGVLRSTTGGCDALAFTQDGEVFISTPELNVTAHFSGLTVPITDVNKNRMTDDGVNVGGYYLYSEDYNANTQHTAAGVDVILRPVTDNLGTQVSTISPVGAEAAAIAAAQAAEAEAAAQAELDAQAEDEAEQASQTAETSDDQGANAETTGDSEIEGDSTFTAMAESTEIMETYITLSDQLQVGTRVTCVVEEVLESTASITIPEGCFIITINLENQAALGETLTALSVGDQVDIDVTSPDTRWNEVEGAIGGYYRLVTDGELGPDGDYYAAPRTVAGVKEDGTLILYTIDGRQPGYSIGATLTQVGMRMMELGCVDVLALDGGGSTTIGVTLPTEDTMSVVNQPSDGSARSVSTAIFLVTTAEPTDTLDHLLVEPYGSMLLSGATLPLTATLIDSNYYAVDATVDLTWSISDGDGIVSADGVFTAGAAKGTTQVTASMGPLEGEATVTVYPNPHEITIHHQESGIEMSSFTIGSNQVEDFTASATYRTLDLISQDNCYTWEVTPASLASVDENGVLTTGNSAGEGVLTVTAGTTSVSLNFTVEGHVQEVTGFETDLTQWTGTNSATLTLETNTDYVRFGQQSLQLDYDLSRDGQAVALAQLPLTLNESYLNLWVYGDGSGNQLSLSTTITQNDGSTTVTTPLATLDFTGWQKLSAQLPVDSSSLSSLQIDAVEGSASSGTLWIDQITTSSTILDDDEPPVIEMTWVGRSLLATVSDNFDESFARENITLTLDGVAYDFSWNSSQNTLSAELPSDDGNLHRVTITAKDQSGNIGCISENLIPEGTVSAEQPFADMDSHWAQPYTTYLYTQGITQGVETATGLVFQPDADITRGEFALMLCRWMGLDTSGYSDVNLPFADVDSIPDWMLDAIKAMYSLGIMQGSQEGDLLYSKATATLTRAEAFTLLGRIQGKGYQLAELDFDDANQIPSWALDYVSSLVGQGVVTGYDNLLTPLDSVTRAEIAKLLYSLM